MDRRFRLVDVFGERPLTGNPLAVVVDTEGLSTEEMLDLTRWLNFSETTFLSPPVAAEADYRVRIFTQSGELPFAGHPTLGSCHVWQSLAEGSKDEIVQECGAGLVRLRRSGDQIAFRAPDLIREGEVDPAYVAEVAAVLGIDVEDVVAANWVDNGPGWVGLLLEDADTVLGLTPGISNRSRGAALDIGVVGMHPEGSDALYEVRAFFSGIGGRMLEDPVTGSLNASLAQWLIGDERVTPPYSAHQGTAMGRDGRIQISTDDDGGVWVGGRVFDLVSGEIEI